jgi:hypothetical protein
VVVIGPPANILRFLDEAFLKPGEPYPDSPDDVNDKEFPILHFDFIVPAPANIERGGCGGGAVNGIHEDTGEVCWYQWNTSNWGTKWGAYSHDHYDVRWLSDYEDKVYGRVDLRFDTAWSQPTPIFLAIEQRWEVTVHAVTQDEGGFPDVEYGSPYDEEGIRKVTTFEFENFDVSAEAPEVVPDGN